MNCVLDFDLTPKKRIVTGSLGGKVTLQWDIIKENDKDQFVTASLILVGDTQKTLYTLDPNTQKPLLGDAESIFGNRTVAEIKDGKTYLLTLQKLNYNDANVFELMIITLRGDVTSIRKKSVIHLIVEGMKHIIICHSVSTK